ncbi:MAG TPA: transglutaminaseTgpA domain-containing protein [Chthonomonadales bacterium]|nr:transglutaminaseTgpA domain-containing protein [Chthonomonadales bacterium]
MSTPDVSAAPAIGASEDAAPPSALMYVAGWVVTLTGIWSVGIIMEDRAFMSLAAVLSTVGFAVSFTAVRYQVSLVTIEMTAAALFAVACLMTVAGGRTIASLAPEAASSDPALSFAAVLTWGVVLRCYTLSSNGRILFSCVPSIAILGLMGTMYPEPILVVLFVVCLSGTCFMAVHENYLRTRRRSEEAAPRARANALLVGQVQVALLCIVGAMALANVLAVPLRAVGQYMLLPGAMAPLVQPRAGAAGLAEAPRAFAEEQEVLIATGPVRLSPQVVMRVRADHGAYWRGTTFDEYTGRGWRNTLTEQYAVDGIRGALGPEGPLSELRDQSGVYSFALPGAGETAQSGPSRIMAQAIVLEGAGIFREIYAAAEPSHLVLPQRRITVDRAGTVHLTEPLRVGHYRVYSRVPVWAPDTLPATPRGTPAGTLIRYTGMGGMAPELRARLRAMATEATAGRETMYDRVRALEAAIGRSCKYNTESEAAPEGVDVVEYFLFSRREGYCDSFAASLTMLCRSIGIPARVASGFLPGDFDPATQEYLVRELHKHQWTEVYFTGVGWLPFDATSEAEDISPAARDRADRSAGSLLARLFGRGWLPPVALLGFLAMLGYVLKVEVFDRLRARRLAANCSLSLPPENLAVIAAYESACATLARANLRRAPWATPQEYLAWVRERLAAVPDAVEPLERLTGALQRFRYSRATATPEDVSAAQDDLGQIRRNMRRARQALRAGEAASPARGAA